MSVGNLFVRLGLDATDYQAGLETAMGKARAFGDSLTSIGSKMTAGVTLPIVAAGTAAVKTFMSMEDAWTGVLKTVDASPVELVKMREEFNKLAETIPISVEELYNIGEAAGQLGIHTDSIVSFSKVMADLGATTNLSSAEAADQLSRFANITQMSQKDFDRLGSSIVSLGNNFATTEKEIVNMAMRLAGQGNKIGITENAIMALAATLSSLGVEAEMGGSAFSQFMRKMEIAVNTGENIQEWAKTAGMSVKDFSATFKNDALSAIMLFIEGLQEIGKSGGSTTTLLEGLVGSGLRVNDILDRLGGSGDLLTRALDNSSQAWKNNSALAREAELRYGTTSSQIQVAINKIRLMAETYGELLAPTVIKVVDIFVDFAKFLKELDTGTKETIVQWGFFAAAIGPVLVGMGTAIKVTTMAISSFGFLGGAVATVIDGLSIFGYAVVNAATSLVSGLIPAVTAFAAPLGLVIVTVGSVGLAIYELVEHWTELGETFDAIGSRIRSELSAMDNQISIWKKNAVKWFSDTYNAVTEFIGGIPGAINDYLTAADNYVRTFISDTWNAIVKWCEDVVNTTVDYWSSIPKKVGQYLEDTYNSVRYWLRDRMSGILSWVIARVDDVSDAFAGLEDDVVGNSYVPDLVDGIEKNFKKLQSVMVDPATDAADAVSNSFSNITAADLSTDISSYGGTVEYTITVDADSLDNAIELLEDFQGELRTTETALSGISFDELADNMTETIIGMSGNVTDVLDDVSDSFDDFSSNLSDAIGDMASDSVSSFDDIGTSSESMGSKFANVRDYFVSDTARMADASATYFPGVVSQLGFLQDKIEDIDPKPIADLSDAIVDMSETAEPLQDVNSVLYTLKTTMLSWSSIMPGVTSNLQAMVAQITPWTQAFGANGSFANSFAGFSSNIASQISNLQTLWIGLTGNMKTAWADAVNYINGFFGTASSTIKTSSVATASTSTPSTGATTNGTAGGLDSNALIHQLMQGLFTNSTYFSAAGYVNENLWDPNGWGQWYQNFDLGKEFRAFQTGVLDAGYFSQSDDTRYFDTVARLQRWGDTPDGSGGTNPGYDEYFKLPYNGGNGYTQFDGISVPYSNQSTNNINLTMNVDGAYFDSPTSRKKFMDMVETELAKRLRSYH